MTSPHVERLASFAREAPPPRATVLLGDSLTQGFAATGLLRAVNRGINGDKIAGVRARLSEAQLAPDPARVVLCIGVNDLGDAPHESERIFTEFTGLVRAIREAHPRAEVLVQTWLPVREPYAHLQAGITAFNRLLPSLGLPVVDAHAGLRDERGDLRAAYSRDGLHLSQLGYARWAECLRPFLPAHDFEDAAWKRLLTRVRARL